VRWIIRGEARALWTSRRNTAGGVEIEDKDIWTMLVHRPQSLLSIATAGHHVEVGFPVHQVLQASHDEGVGINKHKTNGHSQLHAA
jgi:hypothetical protein